MIVWTRQDPAPRFGQPALEARLGKFVVGAAEWDGTRRSGEPPYQAIMRLPGYKASLGSYETEAEAVAHVERAVLSWIRSAGLVAGDRTVSGEVS